MSSPEEIHFHDPNLKPVLETPLVQERNPSQEESLFIEKVTKEAELPLCARASVIPKKSFEMLKDDKWMDLLVNVFGIASKTCFLVGGETAKVVPILGIMSSPFYLYHAFSKSKKRLTLVLQSFKVSQFVDMSYWGTKAADSIGSAVNNITKPFAGGAHISGLAEISGIGILLALIIPIILIVFGAIGALSQPWSMARTTKALHDYEKKRESSQDSIESLIALLDFLYGSKHFIEKEDQKVQHARFALEKGNLNDSYFTNDQREIATQKRIEALFSHHHLHQIRTLTEKISSQEVQNAVHPVLEKILSQIPEEKPNEMKVITDLILETKQIFQELISGELTVSLISRTETLHEKLLSLFNDEKYASSFEENQTLLKELISNLESHKNELIDMKEAFKEGNEIVDTVYADMHRKLCYNAIFLLISLLTLSAGALFLMPGQHTIASGLALASGAIAIIQVLFDKTVSEKQFLEMIRFVSSLHNQKIKAA